MQTEINNLLSDIESWMAHDYEDTQERLVAMVRWQKAELGKREWRPIDKNTPHDGTLILLANNLEKHLEDRWVVTGSYEIASRKTGCTKAGWYNQFMYESEFYTINPTHWMPLPEAPKAAGE